MKRVLKRKVERDRPTGAGRVATDGVVITERVAALVDTATADLWRELSVAVSGKINLSLGAREAARQLIALRAK